MCYIRGAMSSLLSTIKIMRISFREYFDGKNADTQTIIIQILKSTTFIKLIDC
jgi:hypothetical protein